MSAKAVQFVCLLLCVVTVSQGQQHGECLCTVCQLAKAGTLLWVFFTSPLSFLFFFYLSIFALLLKIFSILPSAVPFFAFICFS